MPHRARSARRGRSRRAGSPAAPSRRSARRPSPGSGGRRSCSGSRRSGRTRCCRARPKCRARAGCGFDPAAVCEPKISIMPTTVPNSPSNGAIAAIVPSVVRKRSRSCATMRPTSSIASFITGRGLLTLASPAARTRPSGACRRHLVEELRPSRRPAGTRRARAPPFPPARPLPAAATTAARR